MKLIKIVTNKNETSFYANPKKGRSNLLITIFSRMSLLAGSLIAGGADTLEFTVTTESDGEDTLTGRTEIETMFYAKYARCNNARDAVDMFLKEPDGTEWELTDTSYIASENQGA